MKLTAAEFTAICQMIWGDVGWQQPAADYLQVNLRNIQFWAAEPPATRKAVPVSVRDELARELERVMSSMPDQIGQVAQWLDRRRSGLQAAIDLFNAVELADASPFDRGGV